MAYRRAIAERWTFVRNARCKRPDQQQGKFKKLEGSDGIFEFKSFQIRLLCFFASNGRVVIVRGLTKKSNKHSPQDIAYAEQRRKKFLGE